MRTIEKEIKLRCPNCDKVIGKGGGYCSFKCVEEFEKKVKKEKKVLVKKVKALPEYKNWLDREISFLIYKSLDKVPNEQLVGDIRNLVFKHFQREALKDGDRMD